jgi:hypothetical protein
MASNVEEARQAFLDALEEAGIDRSTADAQTKYIMPSTPTIVGNYADLQRMGAAALTGTIPTPPGMEDVATSDTDEAFTMPPDPGVREALGNDGGAASVPTPTTPETGTGTPPEAGGDLSSMSKAELEDEATRRGVAIPSGATKAEMVEALGGCESHEYRSRPAGQWTHGQHRHCMGCRDPGGRGLLHRREGPPLR